MKGFLEFEKLEENFEQCRRFTRHYAKTFYFASHALPRSKRRAAYAVYAFCRYVDEIADSGNLSITQALRMLDDVQEQLRRVYSGSTSMHERLAAFRHTIVQYQIPQKYFNDLLRGVEMDLHRQRFATFTALREYCYCVASTIGLIMTHIFGVSNPSAFQHAEELGIAMQLTNILRDIGEDYRRGRIYLPSDELQRFAYSEADLAQGKVNENFIALMQHNIGRARTYYSAADAGIPYLTPDGSQFCVRLMRQTYAGILDRIERNGYDVFTRRAYVPTWKKGLLAIRTALTKAPQVHQSKPDNAYTVTPIINPKNFLQ